MQKLLILQKRTSEIIQDSEKRAQNKLRTITETKPLKKINREEVQKNSGPLFLISKLPVYQTSHIMSVPYMKHIHNTNVVHLKIQEWFYNFNDLESEP